MSNQRLKAAFAIADQTDIDVLIVDLNGPVSVTNNAEAVVEFLHKILPPNGLKHRRLYYRDSMGRFDELKVKNGAFDGFAPCSPAQSKEFLQRASWISLTRDGAKGDFLEG